MATTHVVQQGEHISAIAERFGFRDFHTIWDHPANAALAAIRDPHVLFPGDEVVIPDFRLRSEFRPTTALHVFRADLVPLFLRVRLQTLEKDPLKGVACELTVPPNPKPTNETTDGEGTLEKPIPRASDTRGRILAHVPIVPSGGDTPEPVERVIEYDLHIGRLNPEKKFSGQQARLNNLGYFAGYTVLDVEALLWAAEEFSCEHIAKRVPKRPKIKPAPAGGEDDPATAGGNAPTGVQDAAIVAKLRKIHGV